MKQGENSVVQFVYRSLRSTAEWLCRQLDSGLLEQFPDIWNRWSNPDRVHEQTGFARLKDSEISETLVRCLDILEQRFAEHPVMGQVHDSVAIWDRESFCDLLSQVGIDQERIQTVCRKLDTDTMMVWHARDVMERQKVPTQIDDPYLRGTAPTFVEARELLYRVSPTDIPVLLCGETGTGKEIFARALHRLSSRANSPFIALNSGAFPDSTLESELFGYGPGAFTGALREGYQGKLAAANGGTLFLDEVSELPHRVQVALLRYLETGEVQTLGRSSPGRHNVRLVFASQHQPEHLLESGKLRADFYYRISVYPIVIPPLRNRMEDLPLIVANILKEVAASRNPRSGRVSSQAMARLAEYSWQGNIRELKNLLERAALLTQGNEIDVEILEKLKNSTANDGSRGGKWLSRLQSMGRELLPPIPVSALALFLEQHEDAGIQNRDFSLAFRVSESTARRHLSALCQAGILYRVGDKKGSKYFCVP